MIATLAAAGNRVFGVNVNAGSFTLSNATVTASGNGVQIAKGGNGPWPVR